MRSTDGPDGGEELSGEVAWIVFTNPSTGFGVVEISAEGLEAPRASGPLAGLVLGQPVRLVGSWRDHPRHGRTFEADYYEVVAPRTEDGLAAFLASGRFPGVGPVIAQRIVDVFGLEFDDVVRTDPAQLARVRGVSPERAHKIAQAWLEAGALAELARRLTTAGLAASLARRVARTLGDDAMAVLDANPYRLLDVGGVSWSDVEAFARVAGVEADDDRRWAAAAVAAHAARRRRGGHVASTEDELADETARLLRVPSAEAVQALKLAAESESLVCETDPALPSPPRWYRPHDLVAERSVAEDVARLRAARSRVRPAVGAANVADELTSEQRAAVRAALQSAVSVLTGGPGTGKTRTIVEVVRCCEDAELRVACAAPTGRAAKRLEELTGRGATTVHRLLEAQPTEGDGFTFAYDRSRRLPHDLVIVDEWSMADLGLAHALFAAVGDGAHVMLVGDPDQLPSVGPGAVLRDLIAASEEPTGHEPADDADDADDEPTVVATRLTVVHRQAAESRIVTLAHEIDAGRVAVPRGRDGDVFAVPERSDGVAARAAEIVAERAPAFFGCEPSDVQVLAPMYRGPAGVDAINEAVGLRVNPPAGRPAVHGFREGDRVVQTRNDAELEVANGDIGQVVAADAAERTIEVAFPHGVVTYDGDAAADLRPAWCLTVHKAQGGEWPVVVLVLDPAHRAMLWRELVYTAVTRAQEGLLLLGEPGLLVGAAARTGSGLRQRQTLLAQRLGVLV